MKIIEKTDASLKLHYKSPRPFLFSVFGTLFILVGLSAIFFFGKKHTLECEKVPSDRANCQMVTTGFFENTKDEIISEQKIKSAELDLNQNSDNKSNIILVTEKGEVVISEKFTFSETEFKKELEKINSFIQDANITDLSVSQDNRFFSIFVAICFAAIGSGIITVSLLKENSEVFYTFDRNSKQLQIQTKKLLSKTATTQWDFQNIEKAIVRTEKKGYRNDRADIYHLELVMGENGNYPMYVFVGDNIKTTADRIAAAINQVLR